MASHPDFSTGLIYIAITSGFVLLGLLKGGIKSNFILTSLVTAISVLGILSHDEFYLFIIIASVVTLIYRLRQGKFVYLGFLFALSIVYSMDILNPQRLLLDKRNFWTAFTNPKCHFRRSVMGTVYDISKSN